MLYPIIITPANLLAKTTPVIRKISFLACLLILLLACEAHYGESMAEATTENINNLPPDVAEIEQTASNGQQTANNSLTTSSAKANGAKIIYTGSIRMQVDSLLLAMQEVTDLVQQSGGYVASQKMSNNQREKIAELSLRLPVDNFQPTMNALTQLAIYVNSNSLDSRDVTAQWIDLVARLKTKREVRDRYVEVLRNKAANLQDILDAENEIRVITEEIEAKESKLRYLRDQVSMSTLKLSMYQTQEYQAAPLTFRQSFGQRIVVSFNDGLDIVKGLLIGLISVWPLWFIIPVGIWGWRRAQK